MYEAKTSVYTNLMILNNRIMFIFVKLMPLVQIDDLIRSLN